MDSYLDDVWIRPLRFGEKMIHGCFGDGPLSGVNPFWIPWCSDFFRQSTSNRINKPWDILWSDLPRYIDISVYQSADVSPRTRVAIANGCMGKLDRPQPPQNIAEEGKFPKISGKSRLVKYYNLARWIHKELVILKLRSCRWFFHHERNKKSNHYLQ